VPELSPRLTTVAVVGVLAVAIGGTWFYGRSPPPPAAPAVDPSETAATTMVVHIAGAVLEPGLVSLTVPARVADAIDAAGGAAPTADLGAVNLADPVRDGEQIVVPTTGEATDLTSGLVDLNRAGTTDLAGLNGIGPVLAERIVAYREEHGPFEAVEDLLDVPGIGEAKLALLRPAVSAP
jgi:competence protein ComEA